MNSFVCIYVKTLKIQYFACFILVTSEGCVDTRGLLMYMNIDYYLC